MKKLFALVFTCKGSDTKNIHQIFSKKNCIFPVLSAKHIKRQMKSLAESSIYACAGMP